VKTVIYFTPYQILLGG